LQTTRLRLAGALAVAVLLASAGIAGLHRFGFSDPPVSRVQKQINDHLAKYRHGRQTGPAEITFLAGTYNEFVITFDRAAGAASGPDCPDGWLCLYDSPDFGYPRVRFQTCGGVLLSWWGWNDRAESAEHKLIPRDPITPEARAGTVTLISTPAHGTNPQEYQRLFILDDRHRTIADLGFSRNAVDFVYRNCA